MKKLTKMLEDSSDKLQLKETELDKCRKDFDRLNDEVIILLFLMSIFVIIVTHCT
jgi:hypothetical protein